METDAKKYTPTIGIEVHAELRTKTKMFCSSKNEPHASSPNTHVCPVCMGHPGTLPVINEEAVKHVLTVGKAVGGELASYTEFDRKNYFYPDIPKGYQISQYEYPLVKGGTLAGVALTRIHLEEDTARSLHDQSDGSLVDYNRAGVPLMELVTEPVIHDAGTAAHFARELQLLLRTLGVSDANMEKGEMRVEANISVSQTDTFGTKVEVKNLNSFKAVEGAILYEVKRQIELLERGERVTQETRGWDENRAKTFSQRLKESADDYRYFPDPDLPKLHVPLMDLYSRLDEIMPELPEKKRERYRNLGLTREQVEIFINDIELAGFFEGVVRNVDTEGTRLSANYIATDLIPLIAKHGQIPPQGKEHFRELISLIRDGVITSRVAKDILYEAVYGVENPNDLVKERGLAQTNSSETLLPTVRAVLENNPTVVLDYKAGKSNSIQYLLGQCMKETKGSSNPKVLLQILEEELKK